MALIDEDRKAVADLPRRGRVDRGGRLVEQQKPGLVEHRFGEGKPGLLAGGQDPRLRAPVPGQVISVEEPLDALRQIFTS